MTGEPFSLDGEPLAVLLAMLAARPAPAALPRQSGKPPGRLTFWPRKGEAR